MTSSEYCQRLARRVQQEVLKGAVALEDIKVVGPKIVTGQVKARQAVEMPQGFVISDINSEQYRRSANDRFV